MSTPPVTVSHSISPLPSFLSISDEFLEKVTASYNAAVKEGDRKPALRVQEELGALVPETARGWIRQARKRGFPVAAPNPTGRRKR